MKCPFMDIVWPTITSTLKLSHCCSQCSLTGSKWKKCWDQAHWCLLTTMGSFIPHFGSNLSEMLYVVPAQNAEQQACLLRARPRNNCLKAADVIMCNRSFIRALIYHIWVFSETPESFNILCVDLIIGTNISSLCFLSPRIIVNSCVPLISQH